MHKPKIFLVSDDKENLITLEETGYVEEAVLQDYLVDYPDLLPGDQIDPENPRRWLLVAKEMGIPGEEDGGDRWSLDHLFLDQDGVPTFVECKRSSDTRARREVVAQMLDYAANGVEYWDMDRMRQAAAETAQRRGRSLDDEIAILLGDDEEGVEGYWDTVEVNLTTHRVRLVFVADSTPKELRRLVEFLNEEMTNVEVLAVEVKQFQRESREGQTALVPRVVGMTEAAREKRSHPRRKIMTRAECLEGSGPGGRAFFQRVLDLAEQQGHRINMGSSRFSVRKHFPTDQRYRTFAFCIPALTQSDGRDEFQFFFGEIRLVAPESEMQALREQLLGYGIFREAGELSLKAPVTQENLSLVNEIYDLVLEKMDEIVAVHDGEQSD